MTPSASNNSLRSDFDDTASTSLGPSSSIALRLRLLDLLLQLSTHPTLTSTSPTTFPDLSDLLTLYVEFIKPLPIQDFIQFTLPSIFPASPFPSSRSTTHILCEALLDRTIESSAPPPVPHPLTQSRLESLLPHTAGRATVDAQCRVNILLESLVRRLAVRGELRKTKKLVDAVGTGVERRTAKAVDARKKGREREKEGELVWEVLRASASRLKGGEGVVIPSPPS